MTSVLKRGLFGCAVGAFVALSSFAGAPAIAQEEKSPWTKACNTNPNTQKLVRGLFDAAGDDGFMPYEWPNPATGQVEPKV
nr:hypothetical protein [Pseudomonadota bacterium]